MNIKYVMLIIIVVLVQLVILNEYPLHNAQIARVHHNMDKMSHICKCVTGWEPLTCTNTNGVTTTVDMVLFNNLIEDGDVGIAFFTNGTCCIPERKTISVQIQTPIISNFELHRWILYEGTPPYIVAYIGKPDVSDFLVGPPRVVYQLQPVKFRFGSTAAMVLEAKTDSLKTVESIAVNSTITNICPWTRGKAGKPDSLRNINYIPKFTL